MAKGMGFAAAAKSAAASAGVSPKRGAAIIAAGARKASNKAKRANPNLMHVAGVKPPPKTGAGDGGTPLAGFKPAAPDKPAKAFKPAPNPIKPDPNFRRKLSKVDTDRGTFEFKKNHSFAD